MVFTSTRDSSIDLISFKDAILNPNAPYGGLYTLSHIPKLTQDDIAKLSNLDYKELCKSIFDKLGLDIDSSILEESLLTYDSFDTKIPAPIEKIENNFYIQKLYCGPTRAFKDMALQPFSTMFSSFIKNTNQKYLILVATSGDTGPATLSGFANKSNIQVVCIYPKNGTSDVQRLQMTTIAAKNIKTIGINGNFDDAQSLLKSLLKDSNFQNELKANSIFLSAANSVNFGRIAFQIIYHAYSSLEMYKKYNKQINIIVPSGNFGNALGAFYAKLMGFPIHTIYIASNKNNILTEFINTGIYDISNKSLQKTFSPAMDILKSSNVERMLFALFGDTRTKELMQELETNKKYQVNSNELKMIQKYFQATFCDDEFCLKTIKKYADNGIIIDPHTACGIKAYEKIQQDSNALPTILCSTAEWTKFAPTLVKALNIDSTHDRESLEKISKAYNINVPKQIVELFQKEEVNNKTLNSNEVMNEILSWIRS